jgi:hypothetical protein
MNEHRSDLNFIIQQGLDAPHPAGCRVLSSALLFQPRVVGPTVLVGTLLQSPAVFTVLGVVLWWSALVPRFNPFDRIYNATFGARPGASHLEPAPAPRRFSQGMAGLFALAIAFSLASGARGPAYVLEALFIAAAAAIAVFRFCLGSFIFHLLRGRVDFAMRTLPWGRGV